MAKKSANLVINDGKISPLTTDFGLRKLRMRPATWNGRSLGTASKKVIGISFGSNGLNSWLMALKCFASSSAT